MPAPVFYSIHYGRDIGNITKTNCTDGVQWIWHIMNECVEGSMEYASVIIGLVSILCWLIVGFPQMYKNCKYSENIEGLSFFFLLLWFFGDSCNLIGCILSGQLAVQIYTAVYFVFADIVLIIQYTYFRITLKKSKKSLILNIPTDNDSIPVYCVGGLFLLSLSAYFGKSLLGSSGADMLNDQLTSRNFHSSRKLLSYDLRYSHIFYGKLDISGYAIGILSSILYIGSRAAQIYNNIKRKSTDGISPIMFSLAIFGNIFYGVAIFLRSHQLLFIIRHMPWIVGSLGIVLFDCFIVGQIFWDKRRQKLYKKLHYPTAQGDI